MKLTIDELTDIARAIAAEQDPPLEVLAVALGEGGSDRVEVLITIQGCHVDPCRLLVNLDRGDREAVEAALRDKFRDAIGAHAAAG